MGRTGVPYKHFQAVSSFFRGLSSHHVQMSRMEIDQSINHLNQPIASRSRVSSFPFTTLGASLSRTLERTISHFVSAEQSHDSLWRSPSVRLVELWLPLHADKLGTPTNTNPNTNQQSAPSFSMKSVAGLFDGKLIS